MNLTDSDVKQIFKNARVNGGRYTGDELPVVRRIWPRGTFLQRRLAELAVADARGESFHVKHGG